MVSYEVDILVNWVSCGLSLFFAKFLSRNRKNPFHNCCFFGSCWNIKEKCFICGFLCGLN